jgi:hypothetical protein
LEPPVARSENDFDPGAKYHIPSFVPYARFIKKPIQKFILLFKNYDRFLNYLDIS